MNRDTMLDDETRRAVESFVADWVTESNVPSASVAVVDGGDVAYLDAFGARDLKSNASATPDTLYGVASITKSVTATAVLQLVDGGRVELGDPVTEHVDFFENAENPPTVHELLTHSSGMPSDGSSVAMTARMLGEGTETAPLSSDADFHRHVEQSIGEQVAREQVSGQRLPDDRFFYYNTGYEVLGKLVEAVDGRPFPEYVGDEILAPLGMDRSVVRGDPEDYDDAMTPYLSRDDDLERAEFPVKGVGAAGGLLSSASDLATYLQFAMKGGVGSAGEGVGSASEDGENGGEHVLPDDLRARAQTGHVVRGERVDGTKKRYGYGWMRRSFLGDDLVGHSGTLSVTSAYLGFLADRELGVAIAANTAPDVHPMHVGPAVLALVEGEDPDDAVPFHSLREKGERVAGSYESYRGIATADVEADGHGGGIAVTVDTALGSETLHARPVSLDRDDLSFEAVSAGGDKVPVTFEETEDGVDLFVRRWRLHPAD